MTFLEVLSLALNNHTATRRHNKNININTLTEIKTPVIFWCVVKTHCNTTADDVPTLQGLQHQKRTPEGFQTTCSPQSRHLVNFIEHTIQSL